MAIGIFIPVLEIFRFGSNFIFRRIKFGGLIFMILQYIHITLLTTNDFQKNQSFLIFKGWVIALK